MGEAFLEESMSAEIWDCLAARESTSVIMRYLGLVFAAVIALKNCWHVVPSEAEPALASAAFLAPTGWWPKAPDSETLWNIIATLIAALIAAGAAFYAARWAARSTMKNARDLQDHERCLEERSVAALISADLHRKLVMLALLLQEPEAVQRNELVTMNTNNKVLEAALPKLGALGHQGAANLLAAFDGISLLARDARGGDRESQDLPERMRNVAIHVGRVVNTLWKLYKLDRPEPLEKTGINLKAVKLGQLKDLGL